MLLDGDGLIFKDEFLQHGEQGGRNAATQLSTALQDYVESHFAGIAPKIMTKIYANVKGLSENCARGGIINEQSLLDDFVRGFNGTVPLFDLIDIGTGKNKPYDKIGGMQGFIAVARCWVCLCCWIPFVIQSPATSAIVASAHTLTYWLAIRDFRTVSVQLPLSPDLPGMLA